MVTAVQSWEWELRRLENAVNASDREALRADGRIRDSRRARLKPTESRCRPRTVAAKGNLSGGWLKVAHSAAVPPVLGDAAKMTQDSYITARL